MQYSDKVTYVIPLRRSLLHLIIIFFISIFVILSIFLSFYLSTKEGEKKFPGISNENISLHTKLPKTSENKPQMHRIPATWEFKDFDICGIKLAVPPKQKDTHWSIGQANLKVGMFDASIILRYEDTQKGDYAAIVINCASNTVQYTNESLAEVYTANYLSLNNLELAEQSDQIFWSKKVTVLRIAGSDNNSDKAIYLLAAGSDIYRLEKVVSSTSPEVINTTDAVFQSIEFNN